MKRLLILIPLALGAGCVMQSSAPLAAPTAMPTINGVDCNNFTTSAAKLQCYNEQAAIQQEQIFQQNLAATAQTANVMATAAAAQAAQAQVDTIQTEATAQAEIWSAQIQEANTRAQLAQEELEAERLANRQAEAEAAIMEADAQRAAAEAASAESEQRARINNERLSILVVGVLGAIVTAVAALIIWNWIEVDKRRRQADQEAARMLPVVVRDMPGGMLVYFPVRDTVQLLPSAIEGEWTDGEFTRDDSGDENCNARWIPDAGQKSANAEQAWDLAEETSAAVHLGTGRAGTDDGCSWQNAARRYLELGLEVGFTRRSILAAGVTRTAYNKMQYVLKDHWQVLVVDAEQGTIMDPDLDLEEAMDLIVAPFPAGEPPALPYPDEGIDEIVQNEDFEAGHPLGNPGDARASHQDSGHPTGIPRLDTVQYPADLDPKRWPTLGDAAGLGND